MGSELIGLAVRTAALAAVLVAFAWLVG